MRSYADILQIHVAHACNLACESCSHYSNHGHPGVTPIDVADAWMAPWSHRLDLGRFTLVGGEPSIHPELPAFIPLVRARWPRAHIRIVSNGFFLHNHSELPAVLATDGNADLCLSVHSDEPAYLEQLQAVFDLLARWREKHPFTLHVWNSRANWTRRYLGHGAAMRPFEDRQPRRSWEVCPARNCKQLFEGKIWKCPALAYLKQQHAKFGLTEAWRPYLAYEALDPSCSDDALAEFVAREDERFCGMCPAEPRPFVPAVMPGGNVAVAGDDIAVHTPIQDSR